MYGYSSLLRGALCLGIFCGIFAASLHSFQKNPAQFLRAADAAYGVGFLHHAGTQQAGEYLMWLTKDSENCAFNEEDARQRLQALARNEDFHRDDDDGQEERSDDEHRARIGKELPLLGGAHARGKHRQNEKQAKKVLQHGERLLSE